MRLLTTTYGREGGGKWGGGGVATCLPDDFVKTAPRGVCDVDIPEELCLRMQEGVFWTEFQRKMQWWLAWFCWHIVQDRESAVWLLGEFLGQKRAYAGSVAGLHSCETVDVGSTPLQN